MAMGYQHINIELRQKPKHSGMPCGDVFYRKKTEQHTTIILCDGKGHGIKANVAASMNCAYLAKLMDSGFSPRAAFFKLIDLLKKVGTDGNHYSVFSIVRILNDGIASLLTFNMPPPILISLRGATILDQRKLDIADSTVHEANCYVKMGEAIAIMSDGVVEAGIGRGYAYGWGSENLCKFIDEQIEQYRTNKIIKEINYETLSDTIIQKVFNVSQQNNDDDISLVIAHSLQGNVSSILTGPPTNKVDDVKYVRKFLKSDGAKILCGGTTAGIVARVLNKEMVVETDNTFAFTPPKYKIDGIDLATEGAVTLNQLYNILDEDRILMNDSNPVTMLYDYLMNSDKVIFYLGCVNSSEEADIDFIQRGIKTRKQIVPIIAEKLRALGKIVVIEWI